MVSTDTRARYQERPGCRPYPYRVNGEGSRGYSPISVPMGGLAAQFAKAFPNLAAKGWISSASEWNAGYSLSNRLGGADELTRPLEENETLYACAKARSTAAGSPVLRIYASDDPEADDEINAPDDPIVKLLTRRPNRHQSAADVRHRAVFNRTDCGEDFWFLADLEGKPVMTDPASELIDVPAQIIQLSGREVEIAKCDAFGAPESWKYTAGNPSKQPPPFPYLAVLQFYDPHPYMRFRGIGAAEIVLRWIAAQFQAQRYIEGLTRNGGEPGGVLTVPAHTGFNELERQESEAQERVANPTRRGEWLVLPDGMTFTPNQIAPKDMEFGTLIDTVEKQCCKVTGVPPPVIGILTDAIYNNIKVAEKMMWDGANGILVYLNSIAAVLNDRFFPRLRDPKYRNWRCYFDVSEVDALKEDVSDRVQKCATTATTLGIAYNVLAPTMGLDPIDDERADVPPDPYGLATMDAPVDGEDAPTLDENGEPVTGVNTGEENLAGDGVQDLLLNGAQMSAAVDIVAMVSAGELPRDSGLGMLQTLFGLSAQQAESIMASAGTGAPTTPNPNPSAVAPVDPAAPPELEDDDADPDDEAKAARAVRKVARPLAGSELGAYWRERQKRVGKPAEAILLKPGMKLLRLYVKAQIARLNAFARHGKSGRGEIAKSFAALDASAIIDAGFLGRLKAVVESKRGDHERAARVLKAVENNPELARQIEILLLNKAEWEAKMQALFGPALKRVSSLALADAAAETGGVSIGVGHPRVVDMLASQNFKLAGDVTGTLADRVRLRLIEGLSGTDSLGDLQARVREVLPELTESLNKAFANKPARALTIARTESGKAAEGSRFEQFKEDGIQQVQWVTEQDENVRDSHRRNDGVVVPLGAPFPNGLKYPLDPSGPPEETINCFPAGTPVLTRRGNVAIEDVRCGDEVLTHRARWRRVLERHVNRRGSELLAVALNDGRAFGVTPAHKLYVLGRGWVEAQALQRGDQLVDAASVASVNEAVGNVEHPHPELAQVVVAERLQASRRAEHFYSDVQVRQEQINEEVSRALVGAAATSVHSAAEAELALRLDAQSARLQSATKVDLAVARVATVRVEAARLHSDHSLGRALAPCVSIDPLNFDGLAAVADRNAEVLEHAAQRSRLPQPKVAEQVAERGLLVEVSTAQEVANRFAGTSGPLGERPLRSQHAFALHRTGVPRQDVRGPLVERGTACVADDSRHAVHRNRVSVVTPLPGLHDVFNLGVEEDMSYFAGGVLGRNCRCGTHPVFGDAP